MSDPSPIEAELFEEKAASYFRITRKMEVALQALRELDNRIALMESPTHEVRTLRGQLLADAAEKAWFFVVQREALGFSNYDGLFLEYGISDEIRNRMSPKPIQST